MKIKIREDAGQIYSRHKETTPFRFNWKYWHILKKLEGKEIPVEEKEGKLISPAIYGISILPFEIHPDVWEKI
jgi:hypothetical protein